MDASLLTKEWLETDGLGGFASGTAAGVRTRRYHALLLTATQPPTGRFVLVNGLDVWLKTPTRSTALCSHRYQPDVIHPDGWQRIKRFNHRPWPTWVYQLDDGSELSQEIIVTKGAAETIVRWKVSAYRDQAKLVVRPLMSGRDYHSLHRENPAFAFSPERQESWLVWQPYDGVPAVAMTSTGIYEHSPEWYRNYRYSEEVDRGLDCIEDLASPGFFTFGFSAGEAVLVLRAVTRGQAISMHQGQAAPHARHRIEIEGKRRSAYASMLDQSADDYIVVRGEGQTIVAGYPWFTDWGRDTFIALRGLCHTRGQLETSRRILVEWSGAVSQGMLPNLFPDKGSQPEFNSVDASLWYVVAVHDFLEAARTSGFNLAAHDEQRLHEAVAEIVAGYAKGTRYGICMDNDGLLVCGVPGVQLTWMDAKVGSWVITPRIGKPVEVQALWLNAVRIAGQRDGQWLDVFERGCRTFRERFWREDTGCLCDVIDADHVLGKMDTAMRPNQIFAVGGLPTAILEGDRARRVVQAVERTLLTPMGLRTLAPNETGYRGYYEGGVWERDSAYHQGTVWPYLIGAFIEAWLRVNGDTPERKREARERFLAPLIHHLDEAGLGHVSEIADGEPPHRPRGCPFQAWSVGELLRAMAMTGD